MLRELESRYGSQVQFRYWDYFAAQRQPLVERYQVRAHPTTVVLRADGSVAARVAGIVRPSTYIEALERVRGGG